MLELWWYTDDGEYTYFLLQYGESLLLEIELGLFWLESKHFQTPKAQRTQSSEYFDSFNTFTAKGTKYIVLTNPRNNCSKSMMQLWQIHVIT